MDERDLSDATHSATARDERAPSTVRADEEAFSAFYRQSVRQLIGFLVWLGARPADAADIAQETMIKAHRHWATIDNPSAWIRCVASRDWARQIAKVEEDPVDQVPEHSALLRPLTTIDALAQRHEVLRLLDFLPPRQRQVLAWTLDGFSPSEIASELAITPEAVRTSLLRARRAVAIQLTQEEDPR